MDHPLFIQKLIDQFSKFPTVGPRTASRFIFYLMKLSKNNLQELTKLMLELKEKIQFCSFCFNPYEFRVSSATNETKTATKGLCSICNNPTRNKDLLCIVEKESDLISLEKTKKYNGLYFILNGTVSKLKEGDIEKLRLSELENRIKKPENFGIFEPEFKEIIIAFNLTTEGEATALYLERLLKPLGKKITRLGRGLPVGGELEYADEETLGSAIDNRR